MRSRRRIWRAEPFDVRAVAELSIEADISPLLAHLLRNRGITTADAARAFLRPTFADIHDPQRLPNIAPAVERLKRALDAGERIVIYGDYDVDGTTATALLISVLRALGGDVDYYIPERATEGYGMNAAAMHRIKEQGADLLLTVDCGITAREPIAEADRLGLDVIVTDHHAIDPDRLPNTPNVVALIDPNLPDHDYPFTELAGVGLAFKIAHALIGGPLDGGDPLLLSQLDLVSLGTIADLAELRDENRALAKLGMEVLNRRERLGLRVLAEVAGLDPETELTSSHVGFVLGPRINAAGRLDTAHKVVELLTTDSETEARAIATALHEENERRRQIERKITEEAIAIIEKEANLDEEAAILIAREGWHPGVVGIVASRIVERYWRPTVLIALEGETGRGSGRSIPEFHIQRGLLECREWMVTFGGHAAAAGMTVEASAVDSLREAFLRVARERLTEEDLKPKLHLDAILPLGELRLEAVEELALLEPFGAGNPPPRIGVRGLKLRMEPRLMGDDRQHLSALLTDGTDTIRAVHWGGAEYAIPLRTPHAEIGVAGSVTVNEYQSRRSVQIVARDWQIATDTSAIEHGIFPGRERPTWVKLVDNRTRRNKGEYLARVVGREEPTIIYVRDDYALAQARTLLEREGLGERVCECPSTLDDEALRERIGAFLEGRWDALLLIPPVPIEPGGELWEAVRHVLFCHPPPDDATFLDGSKPALIGWRNASPLESEIRYVHLLFNERDIAVDTERIERLHPDAETLRALYRVLVSHPDGLTPDEWRDAADVGNDRETLATAIRIFEELELLEPVPEDRKRFRAVRKTRRRLEDSPTFRQGEIARRAWALQAELWMKRSVRDLWETLIRFQRTWKGP